MPLNFLFRLYSIHVALSGLSVVVVSKGLLSSCGGVSC